MVYVYEPGLGQTYQNGPYMILAGRNSYAATYRGQTFTWGLYFFNEAVQACARHDRDRARKLIPSLYTQRCERAEKGFSRRHQEGK
jgi:hypothetical protein